MIRRDLESSPFEAGIESKERCLKGIRSFWKLDYFLLDKSRKPGNPG